MRPSQCSAHRRSPPSPPSLEKHQHRPDETTGCSCHHTGPSPPGYKEQGDGVFRGKRDSKLGRPAARHSGRLPLTATVPALGSLAQQPSQMRGAGPPVKATRQSRPSRRDCFGAETAPPCGKQRALQRHPSHLLSAGRGRWSSRKRRKGKSKSFFKKGEKTQARGGRSGGGGAGGARAAFRSAQISSEQEAERAEARPSSRGS